MHSTKRRTTARELFYWSPSVMANRLEVLRHPVCSVYRPPNSADLFCLRAERDSMPYPGQRYILALPVEYPTSYASRGATLAP
ncbi:hypothetical protein F442_18043 [Phytophthora nicotianae P10297]|uniref:Uncharacterized protein n=1 Tax=Phytophthora nicotianae P10297 TaxID=1317064 RepID=W2YGS6_PHYNI|nr:hypothetical protein F442_18043 [Phytophthora nicotianae P10297]